MEKNAYSFKSQTMSYTNKYQELSGKMTLPNDKNKVLESDQKIISTGELFKTTVLKKLSGLQENTEKLLNSLTENQQWSN
jgi:hypothetical protein